MNGARGFAAGVFAALIGVGHSWQAATATDYSHECRTASGDYVIDDGDLRPAEVSGKTTPPKYIPYKTVGEVVLKDRRGYCLDTTTPDARGQKFEYQWKVYVLEIAFQHEGRSVRTHALCELATDGLPAAYKCDKEVVTTSYDYGKGAPASAGAKAQAETQPPGAGTRWDHNGSVMRLVADGNRRQIFYDEPRAGLRARNVGSGELLFEGERDGLSLAGTAYIFTKSCGKAPFQVTGRIAPDERQIVMTGRAPRFNARCEQTGETPDRLVFDLIN